LYPDQPKEMIVVVTKDEDLNTEVEEVEEPEATGEETEPEDEASEETDAEDADGAEDEDDLRLKGKREKKEKVRLRDRTWRQYLRRSIMQLLLVASLALSGFLGWKQWQEHQIRQAGEQAQQAAIAYAQVLTSIDSNNVDQNFRQVLDGATGEFKDMYT